MAMLDATCPRCGKRLGWAGQLTDRPTCPKCGHRPSQQALADAQAKIDRALRIMEYPETCDHAGKRFAKDPQTGNIICCECGEEV